jgi:Mor family transcriptional regulator
MCNKNAPAKSPRRLNRENRGSRGSKVADANAQKTARTVTKLVAVNDQGRRVGETHPAAKLTDHDVDLMFALRAEGMAVIEIARKFEVSRWHASKVLHYRRRNQTVARWQRAVVG